MNEKIRIIIPKKSEYISVIRMTTASIANTMKLNIDEIDDLKIIVSELSVYFMKTVEENMNNFELDYILEDKKFTVKFHDLNSGKVNDENDELGLMIIESLSDEFEIDKNTKTAVVSKKI